MSGEMGSATQPTPKESPQKRRRRSSLLIAGLVVATVLVAAAVVASAMGYMHVAVGFGKDATPVMRYEVCGQDIIERKNVVPMPEEMDTYVEKMKQLGEYVEGLPNNEKDLNCQYILFDYHLVTMGERVRAGDTLELIKKLDDEGQGVSLSISSIKSITEMELMLRPSVEGESQAAGS